MIACAWFKQKCVNSMIAGFFDERVSKDLARQICLQSTGGSLSWVPESLVLGRFERLCVNWKCKRVRGEKHLPPQVIIEIAGIELTHGIR